MALVATLALLLAAIFAVCCVLLAAFVGSLLYMVFLHHRLKERGLRREEELLATPLPHDADLPHVVVQIPSFNEGGVLRRGIEAAAKLDWPRDKLHIQVLDVNKKQSTGKQKDGERSPRGLKCAEVVLPSKPLTAGGNVS
jgi:cellulose synthase/poly-beta-1,6-N-acetylglucosamine synthase-like glycosyltransferase